MKKFSKIIPILFVILVVVLVACNRDKKDDDEGSSDSLDSPSDFELPEDNEDPLATIELEDGRKILVQLFPKTAPNTVYNFISLSNSGFYDGLTFHRVLPDDMIQGGDPKGNGTGGPGYQIKGEFTANGFENDLEHTRGVISMARSINHDSAGSQFFIVAAFSYPSWDGQYASFGRVIDGMDYVDEISNISSSKLAEEAVIKSIRVETYGINYPEPEKIPN